MTEYICPNCLAEFKTRVALAEHYAEHLESIGVLIADAKLGRMVRKLVNQPVDAGLCLIYSPFRNQWSPTIDANRFGWFDNPIDALLAAGITDD